MKTLGALAEALADPAVTEVMLNGDGSAFRERAGCFERLDGAWPEEEVRHLVERVIAPLGLRLDRSSPLVDARLPDGSRLSAILAPVAVNGTCVNIRRLPAEPYPLDAFVAGPGVAELLRWAVAAGWNLLISGGTGAGKTSLLASLVAAVASGERIVTVEETVELPLARLHAVRLEARLGNAEGAGAVTVRDLVRAALRLRPDRLVVGEVRGAEAFDLLCALNTGHDGGLSTIHANGPEEALSRIEALAGLAGTPLGPDAIRSQIRSSVDAVVQVSRRGGERRITAVAEVERSGLGVRLLAGSDGVRAPAGRAPRRMP